MKNAHIDENGKILGWYDPKIHKKIPTPNIEVSDDQWITAINNGHNTVNTDGTTEYIEPIKSPEELAEIEKQEASKARDEAMLKGFVYNGMDISVTKDDGDGMVQVKVSFELGLTSTVIHFANGSKLPMTAKEFPAFALQFVTERGKFFS